MKESPYLEGQSQIIDKIKVLPIFKRYSKKKLEGLLRLSKIRQYKPQEVIIEEGSTDKWIYFMITGSVQVEKGDKVVARLEKSGDVFGELGFLDEGPRSSTVRASIATSCLSVDVTYLTSIQEKGHDSFHAAIYKVFAEILAHRLRETTQKFANLRRDYDHLRKVTGRI
ncbi:MAG: cyclic nucleotide-binding domain-containing protein [Candidatus Pacebacteria bacterium]|jgi:CRP-like cAMP-binding protein|nr:cyclic nucleotide-binding domain-containing protein [Candidatus Paceibacterota bacterium]